jgi:hypothetical protein
MTMKIFLRRDNVRRPVLDHDGCACRGFQDRDVEADLRPVRGLRQGEYGHWLEGYYTEEDDEAVIDFGKMAGDMARLLIYCGGHPETDIITASDEVMNQ